MYTVLNVNPLLMPNGLDESVKASQCVLKLSAKYFVEKKALSGSIVIVGINAQAFTKKFLLQTVHNGIEYSIMVKTPYYPHANASHFREKAKNYMMVLENQLDLKNYLKLLSKLPTWNPFAKTIVLYEKQKNEVSENLAKLFINELHAMKLLRVIVLIYSVLDDEIISYSWNPYSETNCGGKCESVYILDRCKDNLISQIEHQKEMFPLDLRGCPLLTYVVISEPYVMPPVRKVTSELWNDAYEFQKGGEINLVKIISQFTNMTLITRMSENGENWGDIYSNGTATGAYGLLRNDSVDLVIGNIEVTRTIRKWFNPTVSYTQDEMTWCVPRARRAATWDNVFTIFQRSTWLATLICLMTVSLLFHLMNYKENEGKVSKWPTNLILKTFGMLLGWSVMLDPRSATFRILMFVWLYFCFNMGISYVSFLRTFLMHPRFEKQISSEADLIQSGIPLGGREIYRSYFETNNASSFYLYHKYNSTSFSVGVRQAAYERNFAVVSSRRQAMYKDQILGRGESLIYCFAESDNLYKYGVALLARNWYPLLDRFNNIIRSVSENGLIEKWSEELFNRPRGAERTNTIVPLGMQHLLGAFFLIGVLDLICIIVFIGELVCSYMQKGTFSLYSYFK
ncbi:unnamed protein product [Pieris brassicae]|uniref:Ionotropic glutamate receptor C-terminal domain-containing protein n=1 Tax=Pieris brassicae TaxID=7116 RepID=A0A9P0XEJ9_PIEBR|nr:unnamed protein product [Pieris brassicae]CAH4032010.1 unnamed protein product [Pieris brassicae]